MRPVGLRLLGFSLIAMSLGCATPAPLVRLQPSAGEVVWVSGRATVTRADAGIRVGVAFDHQDGPALGLRVEVENGTATNLDVDPREFTFTACRSLQPTHARSPRG
jgi:hypothetical protein